jgi:DNA-binding MarR family transcriptional regulator
VTDHEGSDQGAREELLAALDQVVSFVVRRLPTTRGLGLSSSLVLGRLSTSGPRRLTDLAAIEGVSQPSMTQLVSRLEQRGLVERFPDPADKRVVRVGITGEGERWREERRVDRLAAMSVPLSELSPADEAALLAAVPALRRFATLHADPSDPEPVGK